MNHSLNKKNLANSNGYSATVLHGGERINTCNCLIIAFTRSSTNFRTRILSASDLSTFNFNPLYWVYI